MPKMFGAYRYIVFVLFGVIALGCSSIIVRQHPQLDKDIGVVYNDSTDRGLRVLVMPTFMKRDGFRRGDLLSSFETKVFELAKEMDHFKNIKFEIIDLENDELNLLEQGKVEDAYAHVLTRCPDPNKRPYQLILFVKVYGVKDMTLRNLLGIATLGIYPLEETYSSSVVGIVKSVGATPKIDQLDEEYVSQISTFPRSDWKLRFKWEMEPLVNLVKILVLRVNEKGTL